MARTGHEETGFEEMRLYIWIHYQRSAPVKLIHLSIIMNMMERSQKLSRVGITKVILVQHGK